MPTPRTTHKTCWTLIRGAAEGEKKQRSIFTRRYLPLIRSYLGTRWRDSGLIKLLDDAVQEVFLECFRAGGALGKADPSWPRGFRSFLLGVVINVAQRTERQQAQSAMRKKPGSFHPERMASGEEEPKTAFDRAWAKSVMEQAAELQKGRAMAAGAAARRRVELLRLRFEEGLPIREIAGRWGEDPAALHRAYRKARAEFRKCLLRVLAFHDPDGTEDAEREFRRLGALLR